MVEKESTIITQFPRSNEKNEEWTDNRTAAYKHLVSWYYAWKCIAAGSSMLTALAALWGYTHGGS